MGGCSMTQGTKAGAQCQHRAVGWNGRWEEVKEGWVYTYA